MNQKKLPADRVLAVLDLIERGQIRVKPLRCPQKIYAGNVVYDASNGWRLTVFNDCNAWDYLDSVVLPDGTEVDFWKHGSDTGDWNDGYEVVRTYEPTEQSAWDRWRIPGYLKKEICDCGAESCQSVSNGAQKVT